MTIKKSQTCIRYKSVLKLSIEVWHPYPPIAPSGEPRSSEHCLYIIQGFQQGPSTYTASQVDYLHLLG